MAEFEQTTTTTQTHSSMQRTAPRASYECCWCGCLYTHTPKEMTCCPTAELNGTEISLQEATRT